MIPYRKKFSEKIVKIGVINRRKASILNEAFIAWMTESNETVAFNQSSTACGWQSHNADFVIHMQCGHWQPHNMWQAQPCKVRLDGATLLWQTSRMWMSYLATVTVASQTTPSYKEHVVSPLAACALCGWWVNGIPVFCCYYTSLRTPAADEFKNYLPALIQRLL